MTNPDLLSINNVAEKLELSVHQLRRWELMFNLEIKRGRGQQRQYRAEDMSVLERIKELVDQGWPTSQIRPQLEAEGLLTPKLIGMPTAPGNPEVLQESIIGLRNFTERRFIELSKQVDELRQLLISITIKQELSTDKTSPWQPMAPEYVPAPKAMPAQEITIGPQISIDPPNKTAAQAPYQPRPIIGTPAQSSQPGNFYNSSPATSGQIPTAPTIAGDPMLRHSTIPPAPASSATGERIESVYKTPEEIQTSDSLPTTRPIIGDSASVSATAAPDLSSPASTTGAQPMSDIESFAPAGDAANSGSTTGFDSFGSGASSIGTSQPGPEPAISGAENSSGSFDEFSTRSSDAVGSVEQNAPAAPVEPGSNASAVAGESSISPVFASQSQTTTQGAGHIAAFEDFGTPAQNETQPIPIPNFQQPADAMTATGAQPHSQASGASAMPLELPEEEEEEEEVELADNPMDEPTPPAASSLAALPPLPTGPQVNFGPNVSAPQVTAQRVDDNFGLGEVTDQNYLTVLGRALDLIGWTDEQADSYSLKSFSVPHWDELGRSQAEKLVAHLVELLKEQLSNQPD